MFSRKRRELSAKLSIDLKIVAYFHMILGPWSGLGAALFWLAGLSTTFGGPPLSPPPSMIAAFGLFTAEGAQQVGILMLVMGIVTFIAGLLTLKQRHFGWFLLLLLQANGFVGTWLTYARHSSSPYFYSAVVWSVLTFVFATILILRRKQFFEEAEKASGTLNPTDDGEPDTKSPTE